MQRQVEKHLSELEKLRVSIELEIRALSRKKRGQWKALSKGHKTKAKSLKSKFDWAKSHTRDELMSGDTGASSSSSSSSNTGERRVGRQPRTAKQAARAPAKQLLQATYDIQDSSLASLDRSLKLVNQTEEISKAAALELARQGEIINQIGTDLDQLDNEMDKAKSELGAFMRGIATDKIIMAVIIGIIVVVAIIMVVLIGMKLLGGKGGDITTTLGLPSF